jgi:hypothetical protein
MRRADEFRAPKPRGDDDSFVEPEEAAKRMGVTIPQLDDLIRRGAVRTRRTGWGIEVEPAIVNVTPRPETSSPKRGSGTTRNKPRTPVRGRE